MIVLTIQLLTSVVIVAVAVRQCVELARHPSDRPLRLMAIGLVGAGIASSVGIPVVRRPLDDVLGGGLSVIVNISYMTMVYSVSAFFLLAREGLAPRDETGSMRPIARARREVVPLLVAIAVMVAVWSMAPGDIRAHPVALSTSGRWQTTVFLMSAQLYELPVWIVSAWRAARYRRLVRQPWLRRSIALIIVAIVGLGFVSATAYLTVPLHWFAAPSAHIFAVVQALYVPALLGGQAALAAALVLPALASAGTRGLDSIDRRRAFRDQRRVAALWSALAREFPDIVLPDQRPGGQASASVVEPSPERLVTEIEDGLAALGPFCRTPEGDRTSTGIDDPQRAAEIIGPALRLCAEAREEGLDRDVFRQPPPFLRLEPRFATRRTEMEWMVRLTERLRADGVLRDPEEGHAAPAAG